MNGDDVIRFEEAHRDVLVENFLEKHEAEWEEFVNQRAVEWEANQEEDDEKMR
jgi:hypothetical protein